MKKVYCVFVILFVSFLSSFAQMNSKPSTTRPCETRIYVKHLRIHSDDYKNLMREISELDKIKFKIESLLELYQTRNSSIDSMETEMYTCLISIGSQFVNDGLNARRDVVQARFQQCGNMGNAAKKLRDERPKNLAWQLKKAVNEYNSKCGVVTDLTNKVLDDEELEGKIFCSDAMIYKGKKPVLSMRHYGQSL